MRRVIGVVCGLLLAGSLTRPVRAEIVSPEVAAQAATKWLETNFVAKQSLAGCAVETIALRDALYIVALKPGGYLVLEEPICRARRRFAVLCAAKSV